MSHYTHLTTFERENILYFRAKGKSIPFVDKNVILTIAWKILHCFLLYVVPFWNGNGLHNRLPNVFALNMQSV